MKLLVTMGYHTQRKGEYWLYDTAGLMLIDWRAKKVVRELTYVSPPEHAALSGHMLFAYGSLTGSELLVTTHTEVVTIDVGRWAVNDVISLPHFNDLHHVIRFEDHLYVCNTGLQAVQKVTPDGRLVESYSTNAAPTWETYDRARDYRPLSTKPHPVHPNHLFVLDGQVWVTRCNKHDAVALRDHERRLKVAPGSPHDGILAQGLVYFTTTNGHVVGVDPEGGETVRDIDLNAIDGRRRQLGWCRGLRFIDYDLALVGFGQFRRTKYRELAHWILNDGKAALPSRLCLYDFHRGRLLDELTFTAKWEGAAIYSIFILPD